MSEHTQRAWAAGGESPESLANARLIAAAPDMLSALKEIIRLDANHEYFDAPCGGYIRQTIHAAIAKATSA